MSTSSYTHYFNLYPCYLDTWTLAVGGGHNKQRTLFK